MSNNLLIILVLVAMAAVIFVLLRRKPDNVKSARSQSHVSTPARENMLQIVLSPNNACKAAQELEGHRFHKGSAPTLPLANCKEPATCHCRYQMLADRRISERRIAGHEKRESIRYEENPRRKGRGRRAVDKLFDHDS